MFTLEGTINGFRPVSGQVTQGKNVGSYYHFLSLEICDPRFGQVYSCQVRQSEKDLFAKYVKIGKGKDKDGNEVPKAELITDLTGHNVKALVKGISAGERTIENKNGGQDETVLTVRVYLAGLKDNGLPKTDDF
jgi:hypothetical protein